MMERKSMASRDRAADVVDDVIDLAESLETLETVDILHDQRLRAGVVRPALGWFILLDGALLKLAVLAFNPTVYEKARDFVPLPEQRVLREIFYWAIAVHAGEALLARRMARRRGVPAGPWVRQSFVVGFPSLLKLRQQTVAGRPAGAG